MKRIILTGGGSGGHIIPNIALLPQLKKHFEIYYLGQKNSLEEKLIKQYKFVHFIEIKSVKLIRKFTIKNLLIPFKMFIYVKQTKKIIKEIAPNLIFAKGGYVSLPVVLAGSKLHIPIFAHESDLSMGLANKIILKKCKIMFTSFRETCIGNKCIFSGSPIRKEIFTGKAKIAKNICNFENDLPIILIFGGSLGSRTINEFIFNNIDYIKEYNIIHIVGKNNLKSIKNKNYYQIEYADNIYDFFAYANIVICRAGSNSIFELLALHKPMILIPLGTQESRGDQIENAKNFKKNGFANILFENELEILNFKKVIKNTLKNQSILINNMQKYQNGNATDLIVDYLSQSTFQ